MCPLRALVTSFVVVAVGLLPMSLASPVPAAGLGPLPDCRIDDVLTEPRGYDDWQITLVDWVLRVGSGYKPPDLVPVANAGVAGGGSVRRIAIDDLRAMADAAAANGTPLDNVSTYRGYRQQRALFRGYARSDGYADAINYSARPGHSEHQLGLTIDFVSLGDTGLTSNWDMTPTGRWMKNNAWKYGWLMSYPKGKQAVVCYSFEPWHYRYVGRELAREVRDSGLTLREYLWANYTSVDPGTGEPVPTPTADPSGSPSHSAGVSPDVSLAPSASPPPEPTAETTGEPTVPAPSPTAGPAPTAPPPSAPLVGIDLTIIAAGLLLVVALIGLLVARRVLRRPPKGVSRR